MLTKLEPKDCGVLMHLLEIRIASYYAPDREAAQLAQRNALKREKSRHIHLFELLHHASPKRLDLNASQISTLVHLIDNELRQLSARRRRDVRTELTGPTLQRQRRQLRAVKSRLEKSLSHSSVAA